MDADLHEWRCPHCGWLNYAYHPTCEGCKLTDRETEEREREARRRLLWFLTGVLCVSAVVAGVCFLL